MEDKYIVYAKVDSANRIIEIDSSAFISDLTDWIKVDEGSGDKYHHAQGNYLNKPLINESGIYNYKFENNAVVERTEVEKQADITSINPVPTVEERLVALEEATLAMMGV